MVVFIFQKKYYLWCIIIYNLIIKDMRKLICSIPLVLLLVFASSCNNKAKEDIIIDFFPIDIVIYVDDAHGEDALANGTIDTNKITIKSNGFDFGVYDVEAFQKVMFDVYHSPNSIVLPKPATLRSTGPVQFYGAGVLVDKDGRHFIIIGNYNGEKDYDKEPIFVTWPDGSTDKIEFSRSINEKNGSLKVFDAIFLNGEKVDSEFTLRLMK